MDPSRTLTLRAASKNSGAVVYVMSRDQRAHDNHALLAAQAHAIKDKVPLYVLFNLKVVKNRSREHYDFMLSGLEEVRDTLATFNIPFILQGKDAKADTLTFLLSINAGAVYFDFSPLKGSRAFAKNIAAEFEGGVYVVDTHNIVPVWVASEKQEYAAHTMRRKIHLSLEKYLVEPEVLTKHPFTGQDIAGMSFTDARTFIKSIPKRGITIEAKPDEKEAAKHLKEFVHDTLETYALKRDDIADDHQSGLSPYLHFGQLSSLRVALEVLKEVDEPPLLLHEVRLASAGDTPSKSDGMNALFEEMIVRKELSDNFCFYQKNYTSLKGGPEWAQQSLNQHRDDPREFLYTREQWERAETHDESWNAAQRQLLRTGKIHGYMRMYWAKKMLEWSETPEAALADCIYLNDTYSIDGGDPNGYVGILWSMVGLHDRPWFERSVYGKIRYMNEGGLMRKYDVKSYQQRWNDADRNPSS